MIDENHRGLKRWEKARQYAGLSTDPELSAPLASCRIDSEDTHPQKKMMVFILRVYLKDFVCVHIPLEKIPEGIPGPCWLVRGGIDWPSYLRTVILHYKNGLSVPESFQPIRKIPGDLIQKFDELSDAQLPDIFNKMRESGFLPRLMELNKNSCPAQLPWDLARSHFQDFSKNLK